MAQGRGLFLAEGGHPRETVKFLAEQGPQRLLGHLAEQVPAGHLDSAHSHGKPLHALHCRQVGSHFPGMQVGAGDHARGQHLPHDRQVVAEGLGQVPVSVEGRAFPYAHAALLVHHLHDNELAVGQGFLRRLERLGKRQAHLVQHHALDIDMLAEQPLAGHPVDFADARARHLVHDADLLGNVKARQAPGQGIFDDGGR